MNWLKHNWYLISIVLAVIAVGVWWGVREQIKSPPVSPPASTAVQSPATATDTTSTTPSSTAADIMDVSLDTSTWEIYRNEENGFELRYPSEFTWNVYHDTLFFGGIYSLQIRIEELNSFPDSGDTPWYTREAVAEEQRASQESGYIPPFYQSESQFFVPLKRDNVQGFTVYKYFAQDGVAINSFFTFFTPTARVRLEILDLRPEWQLAKTRNEMKPTVTEAIQRLLSGEETNEVVVRRYEIRDKIIETIRIVK